MYDQSERDFFEKIGIVIYPSTLYIDYPNDILRKWNVQKVKEDLPDLRIFFTKGIIPSDKFVSCYPNFDVIVSEDEFMHDLSIHLVVTLNLMKKLGRKRYQIEKEKRIAFYTPFYNKIMVLDKDIELSEKKFPGYKTYRETLITLVGAFVDILAAGDKENYVEFFKKKFHCNNIGEALKAILRMKGWDLYFKNIFKSVAELNSITMSNYEIYPLIDKITASLIEDSAEIHS